MKRKRNIDKAMCVWRTKYENIHSEGAEILKRDAVRIIGC